jgi:hypothetical protein
MAVLISAKNARGSKNREEEKKLEERDEEYI